MKVSIHHPKPRPTPPATVTIKLTEKEAGLLKRISQMNVSVPIAAGYPRETKPHLETSLFLGTLYEKLDSAGINNA